MTVTTTTLPNPMTPHAYRRYVGFALAMFLAFGVGMITSFAFFDDDASPAARATATGPEASSSAVTPTMSADATERWATSGAEAYQRKASVEAAERQAVAVAAAAAADLSRAIDECRATATAPDSIERCAGVGR